MSLMLEYAEQANYRDSVVRNVSWIVTYRHIAKMITHEANGSLRATLLTKRELFSNVSKDPRYAKVDGINSAANFNKYLDVAKDVSDEVPFHDLAFSMHHLHSCVLHSFTGSCYVRQCTP